MYGYTMRVPAPIEAYRAMHAAIADVVGDGDIDGLVVHFAHPTDEGFAITEIWESRDQLDAFNQTILPQAMERLGMTDAPPAEVSEFDPTVVVTPGQFDSDRAAAGDAAGAGVTPPTPATR